MVGSDWDGGDWYDENSNRKRLFLFTTNGPMRATWTAEEIHRRIPLDWLFSAQQGREMRRRLGETSATEAYLHEGITTAHEEHEPFRYENGS